MTTCPRFSRNAIAIFRLTGLSSASRIRRLLPASGLVRYRRGDGHLERAIGSGPDRFDNGGIELGLPHRLGGAGGDPDRAPLRAVLATGRSQHYERRVGKKRVLMDAARESKAVHAGHVGVEQDQGEWASGSGRFVEMGERRYTSVNGLGPHLPAAQHLEENQPVRGVVVHDQHREILQRSRGYAPRRRRRKLRESQRCREVECTALPHFALQPDAPAHQSHQFRRDRETESGASELPGGGPVGLRERIEDALVVRWLGIPIPVSRTWK